MIYCSTERWNICKRLTIFSFAKHMSMNFAKSISKNLSGRDSPGMLAMHQKLLDYAKQYATDTFKTTSKRAIQKTAEVTDDLIGNKIAKKITKI